MSQPFVLTLRIDSASEKLLTGLRTRFFPESRNYLNAHITLFHALPADSLPLYQAILTQVAQRESCFTLGINAPFPLGKKGVGINVASHNLRELHEELLEHFKKEEVQLTDQDQRKLRPHVTVQNKVGEEEARETLEIVKREFKEQAGRAEALTLWRYEVGGEWTHLEDFPFQ
ncbi:hypothetical protein ACMFMG_006701 [Clarireedia jacksonii]